MNDHAFDWNRHRIFDKRLWAITPTAINYRAHYGVATLALAWLCLEKKTRQLVEPSSQVNGYAHLSHRYLYAGFLWADSVELINISLDGQNRPLLTLNLSEEENRVSSPEALDFYTFKPPVKQPEKQGFVYVFFSPSQSLYKIGFTQKLDVRIRQLRKFEHNLSYVLHLPGTLSFEKSLHEKFSSKRKHAEWFDLSPSDLNSLSPLALPKISI